MTVPLAVPTVPQDDAAAGVVLEPLTPARIRHSIDTVCGRANLEQDCWKFRRASNSDLAQARRQTRPEKAEAAAGERQGTPPSQLLYGLVATPANTVTSEEATTASASNSQPPPSPSLATFYLAYSTWDGRVLYVDHLDLGCSNRLNPPLDEASSSSTTPLNGHVTTTTTAMTEAVLRLQLARIAVLLHCHRLTWQQWGEPHPNESVEYGITTTTTTNPLPPPETSRHTSGGEVVVPRPEHLKGWLTLHWTADAMRDFLLFQGFHPGSLPHPASSSIHDVRETISRALDVVSQQQQSPSGTGSSPSRFLLRLAATATDVDSIGRLVQGLADFEKEPDAVHVTTQDYLRDGFGEGGPPLYYCLLLDDTTTSSNHAAGTTAAAAVPPYTCGMALCVLEERLHDGGLFLYLEDLFIEEAHRGDGAGSLVMKALATVALSLRCSKMVWQALHWNTPALTFYGKLGAKVQDGLETLRYTDQTLVEFADW